MPSSAWAITSIPSGVNRRRNSRSLPLLPEASTRRRIMMRSSTSPRRPSHAPCSYHLQRCFLRPDQLTDTALREHDQHIHFQARKSRAFRGALNFDEAARPGHDHVHVGVAVGVLVVIEIEHRNAIDNTDRQRGNEVPERPRLRVEQVLRLAPRYGVVQGDAGAGDRRAARSTVRLKHVAVDADGAFTPLRKIRDGTQAASDETLDFLGAAALLALGGFATHAGIGRARQHSILCREPTATLALAKGRHALFHRGRAQYERLAALDERRAFGVSRIVTRDREAAQLVGAAAALAVDHCDPKGWDYSGSEICGLRPPL